MSIFSTDFETLESESQETGEVLTVSQLNSQARLLLEGTFAHIWILGEISNFSRPSSGHIYFSLKDDQSQIRCAFFRGHNHKLKFIPENGQQVLAQAYVSLYEPRGDYQLIIQHLELAGSGVLQMRFEQLKNKLTAEGLFDTQHKKPLPAFPKKIGVITSPTGAAIRDILSVLKRRFASIPVIIYPTMVQGEQAASQIVHAIQKANQKAECDVLILARGGGSIEDLWPFNEESVARAIFASQIPMISGVGHEVDFTIADFVADLRAPTPSAAAEHVSPDKNEWQQTLTRLLRSLQTNFSGHKNYWQSQLMHLSKRLRHPGQRLQEQMQRIDQLEQRIVAAQKNSLTKQKLLLAQSNTALYAQHPKKLIETYKTLLHNQKQFLTTQMHYLYKNQLQKINFLGSHLDSLSPLKTLDRGFAILTDENKAIISNSSGIKTGDKIHARLAKGGVHCRVEEVLS